MRRGEGVANIIQIKIVARAFVETDARRRAAAVIPENKNSVVGGHLRTVAHEVRQSIHVAHIGILQSLKALQAVTAVKVAFNRAARHDVILPLLGAARLNQNLNVGGQRHVQKLL